VGFVVDKVALGQVFYEYFGFLSQFSFHRLHHIHHHLSPGADRTGQVVPFAPSGHSLTPPQETKKKTSRKPNLVIKLDYEILTTEAEIKLNV
jgi:hypothetical protein